MIKVQTHSADGHTKISDYDSFYGDLSSPPTHTVKTWVDTRSGSSNPDYKRQIAAGVNAGTPYSAVIKTWKPVTIKGSASLFKPLNGQLRTIEYDAQDFFAPEAYDPAGVSDSDADYAARQQFVSKYQSRRTAFQGGVFFGELREAVEMIRRPAKALRDGLDSYYSDVKKRLKKKKKKKSRKRIIQDTWLEYSFGWSPLVNDVLDACKLAAAQPYWAYERMSGVAGRDDKSDVYKATTGSSFLKIDYTISRKSSCVVRYKGAVSAVAGPVPFSEQMGLSWSNVLPTAWELIPYSFLVDYFTNIGDIIAGMSTGTIRLAYGSRSSTRISSVSVDAVSFDLLWAVTNFTAGTDWKLNGYASGGGVNTTRVWYDRSVIDNISVGIRDVDLWQVDLSPRKWANLAALAKLRQ
jgi:hypothetical protein